MSTRSQLWSWLTILVMVCVVVGVAIMQVHHIAVPEVALALAGLCATSLASTFRSILPKNAGIILNGLPFSHLPPNVQAVVRQVVAQMLAAEAAADAQRAQAPTPVVTLAPSIPAASPTLMGVPAATLWQPPVPDALQIAPATQPGASAVLPDVPNIPGEPPAEDDDAEGPAIG